MSRRPVIAGNWKMFKTRGEACETARRLLELAGNVEDVEIVVFPPFTALDAVHQVVAGTNIGLGAQSVHWEAQGAYTSEIGVPMLIDCGCQYVLIGHSETREYLGETDGRVNRRLARVLKSELIPIVCVGESLQQREAGRVSQVVLGQLEKGLDGLTAERLFHIIIAYEPIWAIGTGRTATPEIAQEVHSMIREWLRDRYSAELPAQIRILYGGSVNPGNVAELMAQDDVDGALVGGASLEAESFAKLVRFREQ